MTVSVSGDMPTLVSTACALTQSSASDPLKLKGMERDRR